MFDWSKHGHWMLWTLLAIVGFIIVVSLFGSIVSTLIGQIILFGIIAALVFAADWYTAKSLSNVGVQFAAAIGFAVVAGFISSQSLPMNVLLRACDIVIMMCVFSLSAAIWHNSNAVMKTFQDLQDGKADPLATLKTAAAGAGGALKEGFDNTVSETKRGMDHFKKS